MVAVCCGIRKKSRQELWKCATKKTRKIIAIVTSILIACIAFIILLLTVIIPNVKYHNASSFINDSHNIEGYEKLISLNGYKDIKEKVDEIYNEY